MASTIFSRCNIFYIDRDLLQCDQKEATQLKVIDIRVKNNEVNLSIIIKYSLLTLGKATSSTT